MRRISSRATFAIKWGLPVLWLALLVGAVAARWQDPAALPGSLAGLAVGVVLAVALYAWVIWPLADSVDDDVDTLVVHRHGRSWRVRLADVERVAALPFFNPPRIRLHARRGEGVVFLAPKDFRLIVQAAHPMVDELAARVGRAQKRGAAA